MMLAFGPFVIDVSRRTVSKNGTPVRLTLRCTELLIALAESAGKTLTKQQLLDAAWPDPEASDATLAQHIFLLRRALRHEGNEWIRTVPNVGYRFSEAVRDIGAEDDERTRALETYLGGARSMRDIGTERALRSAIDLCTHALALDEASGAAYTLRANCWRLLAESMHAEPLPCLQSAKADAFAALARAPQDADARVEAALATALLERDGEAARQLLDEAERLQADHPAIPHSRIWLAFMDACCDEALNLSRPFGGALHAAALYMSRRFAAARALFDRVAAGDAAARVMRGACRLFEGDLPGAIEDFHAVYYAESDGSGGMPSVRHYALGLYIYALAKSGASRAAHERAEILERIARTRYVSPMARAAAHLGLGETDRAVALINEARERFDPWSAYVFVDPLLDELRSHPQFPRPVPAAA